MIIVVNTYNIHVLCDVVCSTRCSNMGSSNMCVTNRAVLLSVHVVCMVTYIHHVNAPY